MSCKPLDTIRRFYANIDDPRVLWIIGDLLRHIGSQLNQIDPEHAQVFIYDLARTADSRAEDLTIIEARYNHAD